MKFRALILLLLIGLGCSKDNFDPIWNDIPITGTWFSRDGRIIMHIENLDNKGESERYLEYQEGRRRLLRRTYQDIPTIYEIVFSNGYELHLAYKGGTIEFLKASK